MNTHDIDMGLPPLPAYFDDFTDRTKAEIDVHVRAAIESDRQRSVSLSSQDIFDRFDFLEGMVTEQTYRRIAETAIEIAGTINRQRRGEPVDIRQEVIETLEMILAADWRKWKELASPDEFVRWAKSRANYALSIINEAPQPAEPVKYWLCCGSTDLTHADRKQPDCYDPDKAKFGTDESHKALPGEPVKVPSDTEIDDLWDLHEDSRTFARALLARYGAQPAASAAEKGEA